MYNFTIDDNLQNTCTTVTYGIHNIILYLYKVPITYNL